MKKSLSVFDLPNLLACFKNESSSLMNKKFVFNFPAPAIYNLRFSMNFDLEKLIKTTTTATIFRV